jgi:hypothetical protein
LDKKNGNEAAILLKADQNIFTLVYKPRRLSNLLIQCPVSWRINAVKAFEKSLLGIDVT